MTIKNKYIGLLLAASLLFPGRSLADSQPILQDVSSMIDLTKREEGYQLSEYEGINMPELNPARDFLTTKEKDQVIRISGKNRYSTAVEVSKSLVDRQKAVIVASGENFPDALSASSISKGRIPILLVGKDYLPKEVEDRIRELGPELIIIMGGRASVSSGVENKLKIYGKILRVAGKDRYETSARASRLSGKKMAILASGKDYPDALSATSLASCRKGSIILTEKDSIPKGSRDYLKDSGLRRLDVAGGTNAISERTLKEAKSIGQISTGKRYFGRNRYDTAVEISEASVSGYGFSPKTAIITTGQDFPDALAASSLAENYRAPILLVERDYVYQSTIDFLDKYRESIDSIILIGGERAINKDVEDLLTQAIKDGGKKPDLLINKDTIYNVKADGRFPGDIKKGMRGEHVKEIQEALIKENILMGKPDSSYGNNTEIGIKRYQRKKGLKETGIVDRDTWYKLFPPKAPKFSFTLKEESRGSQVAMLQNALKELGLYKGKVDGVYGGMTVRAVNNFQRAMGLEENGLVDKKTWEEIFTAVPGAGPKRVDKKSGEEKGPYNLERGDSGSQVRKLQEKLRDLGYYEGQIDSSFGPSTEKALMDFQRENKIAENGKLDKNTWDIIMAKRVPEKNNDKPREDRGKSYPGYPERLGSKSQNVKEVQTRLKKLGYYKGNIDGSFGQATEEALKAFQKSRGLVQDGSVGPATWRSLFS